MLYVSATMEGNTVFDHDINDIQVARKDNIVRFLKKHFRENVHYVRKNNIGKRGATTHDYYVTKSTFELINSSYNLKHRYIPQLHSMKQVNLLMTLENQTIGFICSSFADVISVQRQYRIGNYRVDLCFPDHKLVVECDEDGHSDRDVDFEKARENYIKSKGYQVVRFNPNCNDFDLSIVLRNINQMIFRSISCQQN